jgi:hypothetical protein
VGVVRTEEVFMVYINRMVKPCKDSMTMETLVFILSQFPVKDIVGEMRGRGDRVSRDKLLAWLRQEQDQEGEKNHFYIPILAKLLGKLVSKQEVAQHCEKEIIQDALSKDDVGEFESNLLEMVCAKNIDVKRKESVEASFINIQAVILPDMVEAVQEFLI